MHFRNNKFSFRKINKDVVLKSAITADSLKYVSWKKQKAYNAAMHAGCCFGNIQNANARSCKQAEALSGCWSMSRCKND